MPIVKYRTKQDIINILWKLSDGQYFPRYDQIGGGVKDAALKYGGLKKLREEMGLLLQTEREKTRVVVINRKPSRKMLQFMAALHFTQKHGEVDVNACMKAVRNGEFEVRIV